jgi:dTDP-D-glucose 4,6-dehydratase
MFGPSKYYNENIKPITRMSFNVLGNKKVIGIDCINDYYSKSKKYQRLNILKKKKNFKFLKIDLNDYKKIYTQLKKYKIDYLSIGVNEAPTILFESTY